MHLPLVAQGATLHAISLHCPKIQDLDLSGCSGATDTAVQALVASFGDSLTSLALAGCDGVVDGTLDAIGIDCPGAEEDEERGENGGERGREREREGERKRGVGVRGSHSERCFLIE